MANLQPRTSAFIRTGYRILPVRGVFTAVQVFLDRVLESGRTPLPDPVFAATSDKCSSGSLQTSGFDSVGMLPMGPAPIATQVSIVLKPDGGVDLDRPSKGVDDCRRLLYRLSVWNLVRTFSST